MYPPRIILGRASRSDLCCAAARSGPLAYSEMLYTSRKHSISSPPRTHTHTTYTGETCRSRGRGRASLRLRVRTVSVVSIRSGRLPPHHTSIPLPPSLHRTASAPATPRFAPAPLPKAQRRVEPNGASSPTARQAEPKHRRHKPNGAPARCRGGSPRSPNFL